MNSILILENVGYLYDIQDFNIVETFGSGEHILNFTISKEHPYYKSIFEEMKVIYKGYNAYVIKSIDEQQETAIISCRLYLDELQATPIIGYRQEKQSLSSLLDELLFLSGIGWTHEDANLIGIRRTNELDYGNTLDLLRLAQNTYKAVFEYDTINRIIKVMPIENYENKGVYFTDELNLKEVYLRGDSFEYCTRLIPIGAEGLTIESVNQDKNYIENNDYSPKTITKVWKDERFTDPQSLKDEAIEKLKILSKPVRTYDLAVIDMASIDKDYSSLKFNIGDKVTLIDRVREVKVEHQMVKLVRYPDEPERNTAELNMSAKGFTNVVKNLIDGNAIITNIQGKRIAELRLDVNNFSVTLKGYYTKGETNEYVGSEISATEERIGLKVESKSSTHMGQPKSYSKGDTWIVENDDIIKPYKKGDLLTASESNTTYDPKNWSDEVRYGKDITKVNENVSAIELTVEGITTTVSSHTTEINAKNSNYTKQPNSYSIGDTWIVENDTIASPYKTGDFLTAIKSNTAYDLKDWSDKVRYGKDITITTGRISAIEQTVGEIKSTVTETSEVVSGINQRVTKAESSITANTDNIKLKVSKEDLSGETSTELIINPNFVQIAWNNIAQYIQFINAQLQIKNNSNQLLMSLSQEGMNLYNGGELVGQFTTNNLSNVIRGTTQTCKPQRYISWERISGNINDLVMGYFDDNVYVYEKYMIQGLNLNVGLAMHGNYIAFDENREARIESNIRGSMFMYCASGESINLYTRSDRSEHIAQFSIYGLDMRGRSITNANISSYSSTQTRGRSVSPSQEFKASYSSEKLHTHIAEVEVIAGENIIELPEFFKGKGLNYHVFLSKQGSGDVWYSNKTQGNFIIHSENDMLVSYEIKFIIVEKRLK